MGKITKHCLEKFFFFFLLIHEIYFAKENFENKLKIRDWKEADYGESDVRVMPSIN